MVMHRALIESQFTGNLRLHPIYLLHLFLVHPVTALFLRQIRERTRIDPQLFNRSIDLLSCRWDESVLHAFNEDQLPAAIFTHHEFINVIYVVVAQIGGGTPKPPQRFTPPSFVHWAAKLKAQGPSIHAVYEACGFDFDLYRELTKPFR